MERDEALHPPAEILGQQQDGQDEPGHEQQQRAPEHGLGHGHAAQQPGQHADGQEIDPQEADDGGAEDHLPRGPDPEGPDPAAGRIGDGDVADEQRGGQGRDVQPGHHVEEQETGEDAEAGDEDAAQPDHEVLHPPPLDAAGQTQRHLERPEESDGGEQLHDDPGPPDHVEDHRLERPVDSEHADRLAAGQHDDGSEREDERPDQDQPGP